MISTTVALSAGWFIGLDLSGELVELLYDVWDVASVCVLR